MPVIIQKEFKRLFLFSKENVGHIHSDLYDVETIK